MEVVFSPREAPPHLRLHPILPWTELEVWAYARTNGLPVHPLYSRGHRSRTGSTTAPRRTRGPRGNRASRGPRSARGAQDKELMKERLRALGYFCRGRAAASEANEVRALRRAVRAGVRRSAHDAL